MEIYQSLTAHRAGPYMMNITKIRNIQSRLADRRNLLLRQGGIYQLLHRVPQETQRDLGDQQRNHESGSSIKPDHIQRDTDQPNQHSHRRQRVRP